MFPTIMNDNFVSIVIDNKPYTVMAQDKHYHDVVNAIKDQNWELVRQLVDKKVAVKIQSNGSITVEQNVVKYHGEPLHTSLTGRIVKMLNEGFSVAPLVKFLENLMQNPSNTAVNELYDFLETGEMPITPDGHFLAYKRVQGDYMDIYTGKISNAIGETPTMQRNMVDDNRNNTCSRGLHFCSLKYLPHYGASSNSRVMIVKINPADVVSIPADYNNTKGRCWTYEVIGEHNCPPAAVEEAFTKPVDDGESFKPKQNTQESPGSTRRDQAFDIIAQVVGSHLDELEFTIDYVDSALSTDTIRAEAIKAVTDTMGISRKTASEYFRKLKADVANKLAGE